jgi:hypothetical protein
MKQRLNCWPDCPQPEEMFAAALLVHGPYPEKGWSVRRDREGDPYYVHPYRPETTAFTRKIVCFFMEDIHKRYSNRKWSAHHQEKVARRWKNAFHIWVREKIDEGE